MAGVLAKRSLNSLLKGIGPILRGESLQDWIIRRITPRLLDRKAINGGMALRPLRGLDARVLCDPFIFVHRRPYWFGRLHELHVDNFMRKFLAPGDTFIDVGANWGQLTMMAAALVGPTGKVLAFEPNRECARAVTELAKKEGRSHVTVTPAGLGDARCTMKLAGDTVAASNKNAAGTDASNPTDIDIEVGDDVIDRSNLPGKVLLKIDVEGFEIHVLKGMPELLKRVDRAIIEVSPDWIGGETGVAELFGHLERAGLKPHDVTHAGELGQPVKPGDVKQQLDVLFVR